jgi:SprT-like protein
MDIELLNRKAKFYTQTLWGMELDAPVSINNRLKTTYGRFICGRFYDIKTRIELSGLILNFPEIIDDVLLHELTHWYCYKTGKHYKDNNTDFILELDKLNIISSGGVIIDNQLFRRVTYGCYQCKICNKEYSTKYYLTKKDECDGHSFKSYFCCNEKMEFINTKIKNNIYKPSDKILKLIKEFEKTL